MANNRIWYAGIKAVKFVYEIKERHFILFIIKCLCFWGKSFCSKVINAKDKLLLQQDTNTKELWWSSKLITGNSQCSTRLCVKVILRSLCNPEILNGSRIAGLTWFAITKSSNEKVSKFTLSMWSCIKVL